MLTTYYNTRQEFLQETWDYKAAVLAAGGRVEQLWTVDRRIRLLKLIGCWEKLDQFLDARFGVRLGALSVVDQVFSLRGQNSVVRTGAEISGAPSWVRSQATLSAPAFDSSATNIVMDAGTISISQQQDYTIGMRLFTATNEGQMLGSRYNTAQEYWMTFSPSGFSYVYNAPGGLQNAGASFPLPLNQWYFLWIVKDATGLKFYINDQLISSNPVTFDMPIIKWYIGGEPAYSTQPMFWQSCFRARQALTLDQRNALQL